jgi:hypothetical protein
VQLALDAMLKRQLLTKHSGNTKKASGYRLNFLQVTAIRPVKNGQGGPISGPPSSPESAHPLSFPSAQGGPTSAPPSPGNKGLLRIPTRLDIKTDLIEKLDRALTAKAGDKPRDMLMEFRRLLEHAADKLHAPYHRPPDDDTCAAVAEVCGDSYKTMGWLIIEVHRSKVQIGESPMWWVTVALQRIHGISWKDTAARRIELRSARRPQLMLPTIPEPLDAPEETAETLDDADPATDVVDFQQAVAAAAAGKRLL